jgi:hypothetical protein
MAFDILMSRCLRAVALTIAVGLAACAPTSASMKVTGQLKSTPQKILIIDNDFGEGTFNFTERAARNERFEQRISGNLRACGIDTDTVRIFVPAHVGLVDLNPFTDQEMRKRAIERSRDNLKAKIEKYKPDAGITFAEVQYFKGVGTTGGTVMSANYDLKFTDYSTNKEIVSGSISQNYLLSGEAILDIYAASADQIVTDLASKGILPATCKPQKA